MNMLPEAAESLVKEFNKLYPVGSAVFLIKDLGEVERTTIKWPAEATVNGPMIGLACSAGKWLLDRVIPIPGRIVAMGEALNCTNYELRDATLLHYVGFLLGIAGLGETPTATFVFGDDGQRFSIQVTVSELNP